VAALYERLLEVAPSPVVALNHAVAVAETGRIDEALELIGSIQGLERYQWFWSARADLLRRVGRCDDAAAAYRRALGLASNPAERSFLTGRLHELGIEGG
jgi:RNA polymerase sigma-70 factor (ECF subfamily)